MKRENLRVNFIDFSSDYLKEMVDLGNERFGEKYTNEVKLKKYAENKNNVCKLAIDLQGKSLIGFFLMHGTNIAGLSDEFKLEKAEIKKIIGNNEKICVAKSLVIQKKFEKFGIATELVKEGLKKAQQMNFYSCWSPLWIKKDGTIPAEKVIKTNGFSFYKKVHMLWFDDKDYKCIECNGPCKCDAAVYYRIL